MNWTNEFQNWGVALLMAAFVYTVSGPIFRSANTTGNLTWRARRWRLGGALIVLLAIGGFDVFYDFQRDHIAFGVAVALWLVLGWLTVLLFRWWWQDWQKEKAALAALIEKSHQEGQELLMPQMSRGKKAWNWVLIVYGGLGLVGGVYAIILHLLGKAH